MSDTGAAADAVPHAPVETLRARAHTKGTAAARKKVRKRMSHVHTDNHDSSHAAPVTGNVAEGHHSAHQVSFYAKPHQSKQWGDPDPEHHFDSFALFFDLIFVGGAYAAGNLLKAGLHLHGILMFSAVMLVLRDTWNIKVLRDGRFHFDSAFHSLLDMFHLVLVMLLVLQVEEYQRMQDGSTGSALGFSVISLLIRAMEFGRNAEISKTSATPNGKRTWKTGAPTDIVGLVAFSAACWYAASNDDLTLIWIPWMVAPVLSPILYMKLMVRSKRRGTSKRDFVPLNLTFLIHRNAEWAMLMLGESIFSLLIVPVEHTFEFTVVFILGTLITANVYYHHFELYEEMPKYHAMKLSSRKGLLFSQSRALLSVTLVAMGVSLKIMLLNHEQPYLKSKYIHVFAVPFALTLIISDFTALLHNNGTSGIYEYVRIIYESLGHPIGRNLALVWLGKFAIYGVSFALPSMTLSSLKLAGIGCGLSFFSSLLVVLQSEPYTDITVLKRERTSLVTELLRRQHRAGVGEPSDTERGEDAGSLQQATPNLNYLELGGDDQTASATASDPRSEATPDRVAPAILVEAAVPDTVIPSTAAAAVASAAAVEAVGSTGVGAVNKGTASAPTTGGAAAAASAGEAGKLGGADNAAASATVSGISAIATNADGTAGATAQSQAAFGI